MNPNPSLLRAIRGPVMLIAVGALFALDYNGGYSFGRTWPALLILGGLLRLAEMMGGRQV